MASIAKVCSNLDSALQFLTPLLPLANCHMVEFFTQNHWLKLVPQSLRVYLESLPLEEALDIYWDSCENSDHLDTNSNELTKWVAKARSHYTSLHKDYCLSLESFKEILLEWGGQIDSELCIKEFMNNKKSHEVQKMSPLVASLFRSTSSDCCIDLGGGRGHLPIALTLGHHIPALTVDCDEKNLAAATHRFQAMKKQWKAISKKSVHNQNVPSPTHSDRHRCARVYVTGNTDLAEMYRQSFPEFEDMPRLLLTGLHTCGNLGPDSLRIFTSQPWVVGLINVPCCYHLLTEKVDTDLFDCFQKEHGCGTYDAESFPMSEYLRGFNVGRNGRMLAAQSIHRVVSKKQLPSRSILYRALLQVLIKRHRPNFRVSEGRLKRIGASCANFASYVERADAMLDLRLRDVTTADAVQQTETEDRWKQVVLFYLLRLCLAQVVEGVILLDRLLFLLENGFHRAYLVKLFDPVRSPRCHSLVAVR